MSSSAPVAVTAAKICFNSHCKEALGDPPPARRKGWRLRSGEIAALCDRCSCPIRPSPWGLPKRARCSFEQGKFCETFHSDDGGWRNCETCGKRVHCGCIVSVSTYVFLDAGGVDCVTCARKSVLTMTNQMFSSPVLVSQQASAPTKSWKAVNGPIFGQWRQAPHMWNMTSAQSDLQQRLSFEFDRPNSIEKLTPGGRYSIFTQDKKFENLAERPTSGLNSVVRERYANGKVQLDATSVYGTFREGNTDALQDSHHVVGDTDSISTRKTVNADPCSIRLSDANSEVHSNSRMNSLPPSVKKEELSLAASFQSMNGSKESVRFSAEESSQSQAGPPHSKQFYPQNVIDTDLQTQIQNGKPLVDNWTRSQLLPRYWPRISEQELQKISGDSNSVITPLFEKMLSASDAGRIGRLVLPKKCAEICGTLLTSIMESSCQMLSACHDAVITRILEKLLNAYFPTISQPEGLPLKVQDSNGKEWVFQFRFWPNNNSRMYVLEGVTPCIQAMQLQAGDTVTFSRIDPEGKLIMGFRKASTVCTEQDPRTLKSNNGMSTIQEGENKGAAKDIKSNTEARSLINIAEQRNCSKFSTDGLLQKDVPGARSLQSTSRRKSGNLGNKNKRLRIDNEDSMELKITWEEAQQLLRPPPNCVPSVVLVEGHEFEEYEEAPVLGKPTYFTTNQAGENYQWAECENCSKWRRLPMDAFLPSRWTCYDNSWDPERSSCSASQEMSLEQLAELIPCKAGESKKSKVKVESGNIEASGGLDTLANVAILGEGDKLPPPSQATTKHPRHRPGCTCIVCIQPPSGKGPKHKQTCTCNVCLTVKRRFRTLMLRREKRASEKEADTSRKQQKPQLSPSPEKSLGTQASINAHGVNKEVTSDEVLECKRVSLSPLKAPQIDLNIQPEREEEPSPKSDAGNTMVLRVAAS